MPPKSNLKVNVGTHSLDVFRKTSLTHTHLETYSDEVKREIAVQYYTLMRDPSYNQTKASVALAKLHNVSSASILTWVKKHGDKIVTPTPKVGERKAKAKIPAHTIVIEPNNPKVTDGFSTAKPKTFDTSNIDSIASIINKTSPSTIDKLANLLKLIPSVEISISIKPSK